ncbi:hypothetical protein [Embleya sp. AB8]|uniref:hypothetical protein n=1 Tax=Embleya sp. AB8 TaxID=3156304 RepID=UPI003C7474A4
MKKISAAVAAVLVSGAVMTTAAITTAPAYAQDRPTIATAATAATATATATAGQWSWTGTYYAAKSSCVADGRQYEREGFPYQCRYEWFEPTKQYLYTLYIYN